MAKSIPILLKGRKKKELEERFLSDELMDPEFKEIYRQILLHGKSAYEAAKYVDEEAGSMRQFKTLWYHARDIEKNILQYLGDITVDSLLEEFEINGEIKVPDELQSDFKKRLKAENIDFHEYTVFTSPSV